MTLKTGLKARPVFCGNNTGTKIPCGGIFPVLLCLCQFETLFALSKALPLIDRAKARNEIWTESCVQYSGKQGSKYVFTISCGNSHLFSAIQ